MNKWDELRKKLQEWDLASETDQESMDISIVLEMMEELDLKELEEI